MRERLLVLLRKPKARVCRLYLHADLRTLRHVFQHLRVSSLKAALLVRALKCELLNLLAYVFYFRILQYFLLAHRTDVFPLKRALQAKPAAAVRSYALHHVLVADLTLGVLVRIPQLHPGNRWLYLLHRVWLLWDREKVRWLRVRQPALEFADKMRIFVKYVCVRLIKDQ